MLGMLVPSQELIAVSARISFENRSPNPFAEFTGYLFFAERLEYNRVLSSFEQLERKPRHSANLTLQFRYSRIPPIPRLGAPPILNRSGHGHTHTARRPPRITVIAKEDRLHMILAEFDGLADDQVVGDIKRKLSFSKFVPRISLHQGED